MAEKPWYPFFVGDYSQKTKHLSMLEHGAYRLLIDHYFATKSPLPNDPTKLFRICGARSPSERKAVLSVTAEFFTENGTTLRHERCDSEIAKSLKKSQTNSANAKRPNQRSPSEPTSETASTCARVTTTVREEEKNNHSSAASGNFREVYDEGTRLFPQLAPQNTSAIHAWLAAGCSVELDILPELRRQQGRPVRGWNYFTGAVMDAKATRERPPPNGVPRQHANGTAHRPITAEEMVNRMREKGKLEE